jgi:hypothetical protein
MHVEAHELVAWLTRRGDLETAFEVEGALPPHLDTDTEEHRALLSEHGVDVDLLHADFAPRAGQDPGSP